MDLVTRIKGVPLREHLVVTMARKDNFSYLWDCRRLDTFLNYYEQPLYGNQRIGLDVTSDGNILVMGSESGVITGRGIDSGEILYRHFTNTTKTVSSLCSVDNGIVYAVGER